MTDQRLHEENIAKSITAAGNKSCHARKAGVAVAETALAKGEAAEKELSLTYRHSPPTNIAQSDCQKVVQDEQDEHCAKSRVEAPAIASAAKADHGRQERHPNFVDACGSHREHLASEVVAQTGTGLEREFQDSLRVVKIGMASIAGKTARGFC